MESEFQRWSRIFSGSSYFYGVEPGPVARRAVRYHAPLSRGAVTALDVGCGEGQDIAFLAQSGYQCTGLEWTPQGIEKSARLLSDLNLQAHLEQQDLRAWVHSRQYDLVLAVNVLQFLGSEAPAALQRVLDATAPGGVVGISMFAREDATSPACQGSIYRFTLDELMERFRDWQPYEAARLWQWGAGGPQPFVTLIAGKLKLDSHP